MVITIGKRTLKGDKLCLLQERLKCCLVLKRRGVLLHGSKTLFGILQVSLEEASDSIPELLVIKAFIKLESMFRRYLAHLLDQVVVEGLLLF